MLNNHVILVDINFFVIYYTKEKFFKLFEKKSFGGHSPPKINGGKIMARKIMNIVRLVLWYELTALVSTFITATFYSYWLAVWSKFALNNTTTYSHAYTLMLEVLSEYIFEHGAPCFGFVAVIAAIAALIHACIRMRNKD